MGAVLVMWSQGSWMLEFSICNCYPIEIQKRLLAWRQGPSPGEQNHQGVCHLAVKDFFSFALACLVMHQSHDLSGQANSQ